MGSEQEQPQLKRIRLADAPQQPQSAPCGSVPGGSSASGPSSTTGATVAIPAQAAAAPKLSGIIATPSVSTAVASSAGPQSSSAAEVTRTSGPAVVPATIPTAKPSNFVADAHEVVHFRAVSRPTAESITAEIAAGGQPVSVDFLHQHFGDSEQIRGYSGLKIMIWIHVRTYHAWVDITFTAKRPGADKLGSIFEIAFPSGYCRSQEEFVAAAAATAADLGGLMTTGDCVGTVQLPCTAYGIKSGMGTPVGSAASTVAAAEASCGIGSGGGGGSAPLAISVRRFRISDAPPEIKALHSRMEPLLLFTIDGAQFIDSEDPQWELLLPVVGAEDGGCLVLGLTTLFNFFSYPESCRLRVSQVMVLSPWQGLGLGKALLKLSYDLAKSRSCADLTVEDPTPNLQRVREKLEVEMLRSVPWVVVQARKCLDAVARGGTSWPVWCEDEEEEGGKDTAQRHHHQQQLQQLQLQPQGGIDEEGGQQGQETKMATEAVAEEKDKSREGRIQGAEETVVRTLLSTHAFFSALGATEAQKGLSVPEEVHVEATAAAAAVQWQRRRRWEGQRQTMPAAAAVEGEAGASSSFTGTVAVTSNGGSGSVGDAATAATTAVASTAAAALTPSPSFLSAICRELKMHLGQIRIVWEALLWCEPGALRRPRVRQALEQLVSNRIENQYFSSVGRAASSKRLVEIPHTALQKAEASRTEDAETNDSQLVANFFMYRPVGRSGPTTDAVDCDGVATGRLNLTQVSAEDKVQRMEELLQERRLQLQSLAAKLNIVSETDSR